MDDLTITKLCAEAMDLEIVSEFGQGTNESLVMACPRRPDHDYSETHGYDPLHDDAQVMALVKKFRLSIAQHWRQFVRQRSETLGWTTYYKPDPTMELPFSLVTSESLNRAICLCVHKMQTAKAKP